MEKRNRGQELEPGVPNKCGGAEQAGRQTKAMGRYSVGVFRLRVELLKIG